MTRRRRIWLWCLVLSPVVILPAGVAGARIWLNHHLQREIAIGEYRLRLVNPSLDWSLDFSADSIDLAAPGLHLETGRVAAEVHVWNSIASIRPSVKIETDTVRMSLLSGDRDASARKAR